MAQQDDLQNQINDILGPQVQTAGAGSQATGLPQDNTTPIVQPVSQMQTTSSVNPAVIAPPPAGSIPQTVFNPLTEQPVMSELVETPVSMQDASGLPLQTAPEITPEENPLVPPIQKTVDYSRFKIPEQTDEQKANTALYTMIGIVVLLVIGVIIAVFFRSTVFGPLSFADCIKTEDHTVIETPPRYCVSSNGDVFFEDNSSVPNDTSNIEPTPFDQSIVPGLDSGQL